MMTMPELSAPSDAPVYIAIGAQLSTDALVDIAAIEPRATLLNLSTRKLLVKLAYACKQINIQES